MNYLPVKLEKKTKGEDLLSAFKYAAKEMGLETKINTRVTSAQLGSLKINREADIYLMMPYFGGRLTNGVAYIPGISLEGLNEEFILDGSWPHIIGPSFKDFNWKKYLDLVSQYLKKPDQTQPAN